MGVPAAACPEDMYYTEILLPAMVKRTRKYRSPAATANLFWIPHRSTCQYHACLTRRGFAGTGAAEDTDGGGGGGIPAACKAEVAATFDAIWRHVATTARHWNASAGSDHIVVFAWDAASELLGSHPVREHIRPAIHLTHYGTVRWPVRAGVRLTDPADSPTPRRPEAGSVATAGRPRGRVCAPQGHCDPAVPERQPVGRRPPPRPRPAHAHRGRRVCRCAVLGPLCWHHPQRHGVQRRRAPPAGRAGRRARQPPARASRPHSGSAPATARA